MAAWKDEPGPRGIVGQMASFVDDSPFIIHGK